MSIIKWRNPEENFPSFSSFFEDFFTRDNWMRGANLPAVNISEDSQNYEVEVAAPGLKKEDFKIDLDHNLLTISAERKEESEKKDKKISRKEFSYTSFKRSFTLPENIDSDRITAKYENGVLKLSLPKTEDENRPKKQISIS